MDPRFFISALAGVFVVVVMRPSQPTGTCRPDQTAVVMMLIARGKICAAERPARGVARLVSMQTLWPHQFADHRSSIERHASLQAFPLAGLRYACGRFFDRRKEVIFIAKARSSNDCHGLFPLKPSALF
jgi:hypothetical protein